MKMLIEEITTDNLVTLNKRELLHLRLRCAQVWEKVYKGKSYIGLPLPKLLEKYAMLKSEIKKREGINKLTTNALDRYLFRKAMVGDVDPTLLTPIVVAEDCIVAAGSFVENPKTADAVDLVFTNGGEYMAKEHVKEAASMVAMLANKGVVAEYVYDKSRIGSSFIPLFDLMLIPKTRAVRVAASPPKAEESPGYEDTPTLIKAEDGMEDVDLSKPYPNEHACRLNMPGKYIRIRRGARPSGGKRLAVLYGVKKDGKSEIQAYRYAANSWTAAEARAHCKEHGGHFEQALKKADVGAKMHIMKADKAEQVVGGVVYEPGVVDAQGDYTTSPEIRKAMFRFMEFSPTVKLMHEQRVLRAPILENFQVPADFEIMDPYGDKQHVKKGSWWLTVRVRDEDIWAAVENGQLTGFSMGGTAQAVVEGAPQVG